MTFADESKRIPTDLFREPELFHIIDKFSQNHLVSNMLLLYYLVTFYLLIVFQNSISSDIDYEEKRQQDKKDESWME